MNLEGPEIIIDIHIERPTLDMIQETTEESARVSESLKVKDSANTSKFLGTEPQPSVHIDSSKPLQKLLNTLLTLNAKKVLSQLQPAELKKKKKGLIIPCAGPCNTCFTCLKA